VQVLQAAHRDARPASGLDGGHGRRGAGEGGDGRYAALEGGGTDLVAVAAGAAPERRVYHEDDLAAGDEVHDVRLALEDLVDDPHRDAEAGQGGRRAPRRVDREPKRVKALGEDGRRRLVAVADREEDAALERQRRADGGVRLAERRREVVGDPHDLPGRLHLRSQARVAPREAVEGKHRFLDADVLGHETIGQMEVAQALAEDHARGELGELDAGGLAHERDGARAARVHLEDVQSIVLEGELDVDEPAHAQRHSELPRLATDLLERALAQRQRGDDTGRVAGVHPGLLDVLHDGADVHVLAVAEGVHVDLDRVLEEAVDEHRVVGAHAGGALHIADELVLRIDDLHGAPAEDV